MINAIDDYFKFNKLKKLHTDFMYFSIQYNQ